MNRMQRNAACDSFSYFTLLSLTLSLLFIYVDRRAFRESNAISLKFVRFVQFVFVNITSWS